MSVNVICMATPTQARVIVEGLREDGLAKENISVLTADQTSIRDLSLQNQTKAAEGAAAGTGTGVLLGGALGWLIGMGTLVVPGLGPVIAAGPILAALSSAALGGTVGGVTGALFGMGIPEFEAKQFEGKLKTGGNLISVHAQNVADVNRARHVFLKAGVSDISTSNDSADT